MHVFWPVLLMPCLGLAAYYPVNSSSITASQREGPAVTSGGRYTTRTHSRGTASPSRNLTDLWGPPLQTNTGQCTKTGCHARAYYHLYDWGSEVVTKTVATAVVKIVGNRTTTEINSNTEEETEGRGPTRYRTNGLYEIKDTTLTYPTSYIDLAQGVTIELATPIATASATICAATTTRPQPPSNTIFPLDVNGNLDWLGGGPVPTALLQSYGVSEANCLFDPVTGSYVLYQAMINVPVSTLTETSTQYLLDTPISLEVNEPVSELPREDGPPAAPQQGPTESTDQSDLDAPGGRNDRKDESNLPVDGLFPDEESPQAQQRGPGSARPADAVPASPEKPPLVGFLPPLALPTGGGRARDNAGAVVPGNGGSPSPGNSPPVGFLPPIIPPPAGGPTNGRYAGGGGSSAPAGGSPNVGSSSGGGSGAPAGGSPNAGSPSGGSPGAALPGSGGAGGSPGPAGPAREPPVVGFFPPVFLEPAPAAAAGQAAPGQAAGAAGPAATPATQIRAGGAIYTADTDGKFNIGGQTLTPGGIVTAPGGAVISLDQGGSLAVVDGATQAVAPGPAAAGASGPIYSVGGLAITAQSGSTFVIGSQTLSPGGPPITVDGRTISLSGPVPTAVVVDGETRLLVPPAAPTAGGGSFGPGSVLTLGGQTYTANSAGAFVVGSQTLTPGDPALTVNGTTISLQATPPAAIIDGSTQLLGAARATGAPAVITFDGSTYTADASGDFVLSGRTIVPGGPPVTIGTEVISLAPGGSVVVVDGTTLTLGGAEATSSADAGSRAGPSVGLATQTPGANGARGRARVGMAALGIAALGAAAAIMA